MILITPSASPQEAALPLHRQAVEAQRSHMADQRGSQECGFGEQEAGSGLRLQIPPPGWTWESTVLASVPTPRGEEADSTLQLIREETWTWLSHPNAGGHPSPKPRTGLVTSPPGLGPPPPASPDSSPPPPGALGLRTAPPLSDWGLSEGWSSASPSNWKVLDLEQRTLISTVHGSPRHL